MRYRLVVRARPQLPKRFIWQIVHDDGKDATVRQTSGETFATMDAAYEKGAPVLAEIRARINRE